MLILIECFGSCKTCRGKVESRLFIKYASGAIRLINVTFLVTFKTTVICSFSLI